MNRTILQKCLDELSKEGPNIDYVRGMLETLIAMLPPVPMAAKPLPENLIPNAGPAYIGSTGVLTPTGTSTDEGVILDAKARAGMSKVQQMAQQSLETA